MSSSDTNAKRTSLRASVARRMLQLNMQDLVQGTATLSHAQLEALAELLAEDSSEQARDLVEAMFPGLCPLPQETRLTLSDTQFQNQPNLGKDCGRNYDAAPDNDSQQAEGYRELQDDAQDYNNAQDYGDAHDYDNVQDYDMEPMEYDTIETHIENPAMIESTPTKRGTSA